VAVEAIVRHDGRKLINQVTPAVGGTMLLHASGSRDGRKAACRSLRQHDLVAQKRGSRDGKRVPVKAAMDG
jgi:hypothetical protein